MGVIGLVIVIFSITFLDETGEVSGLADIQNALEYLIVLATAILFILSFNILSSKN
jgi:hypothetical protein